MSQTREEFWQAIYQKICDDHGISLVLAADNILQDFAGRVDDSVGSFIILSKFDNIEEQQISFLHSMATYLVKREGETDLLSPYKRIIELIKQYNIAIRPYYLEWCLSKLAEEFLPTS